MKHSLITLGRVQTWLRTTSVWGARREQMKMRVFKLMCKMTRRQIAYLSKHGKCQIASLNKFVKEQMLNCLFNEICKMTHAKSNI